MSYLCRCNICLAVRQALQAVAAQLDALRTTAGLEAFFLAVDPADGTDDSGFLGGTTLGRDFWRGLRNGGDAGARLFKHQCKAASVAARSSGAAAASSCATGSERTLSGTRRTPAVALKNNLYNEMRTALR